MVDVVALKFNGPGDLSTRFRWISGSEEVLQLTFWKTMHQEKQINEGVGGRDVSDTFLIGGRQRNNIQSPELKLWPRVHTQISKEQFKVSDALHFKS